VTAFGWQKVLQVRPSWWGLLFLGFGLCVLIIGQMGDELLLSQAGQSRPLLPDHEGRKEGHEETVGEIGVIHCATKWVSVGRYAHRNSPANIITTCHSAVGACVLPKKR